jgi:mono/diheme cytochrome c family protein
MIRTALFALAALALIALSARAEPDAKIVRAWKAKCASCHGVDGKGKTDSGEKLGIPDMTAADWQGKISDAQMKKAIQDGVTKPGKPDGMEGYKEKLSEEQIDGLVALVRGLK